MIQYQANLSKFVLFNNRVRHLPLEDMGDCVLPHHIEEEIFQSRLQIVLLSPTLLQFLSRCPSLPIGRLLHPDRVLAIMLGVKDSLITQEHRSGKIFIDCQLNILN